MDKAKAALLAAGIALGAGGASVVTAPAGSLYVHRFEVARLPGEKFATSNVYAARFDGKGVVLRDEGAKRFNLNADEQACLTKAMNRAAAEYK